MIGEQIGQYEILENIGEGGMATVYRAHQAAVGRDVALKVLPRQLSEDPTFLKRFQHEARIIARLEHRSILPVYDYGEHNGTPYIVMRLLNGGSLRQRLYFERLPSQLTTRIIDQVAEALDHAHSKGVLHRDLKPNNILLDDRNNAYLTDFGIAKILGEASKTTGEGVVGTPTYMSPEQCQGKPLGPASDIYSLGVITYEIMTGRPPFMAETPLAVMYMHVKDPVPSVQKRDDNMPAALDRVIRRALSKQPDHRYPTAAALAANFKHAIRGWQREGIALHPPFDDDVVPPPAAEIPELVDDPVEAEKPAGVSAEPTPRPERPPDWTDRIMRRRRTQRLTGFLGLALLIIAIVAGVFLISWSGDANSGVIAPTLPPVFTPGATTDTSGSLPLLEPAQSANLSPTPGILLEPTTAAPLTPTPSQADFSGTPVTPTALIGPTTEPTYLTQGVLDPTSLFPTPSATATPIVAPGRLVFAQGFSDAAEIAVIDASGVNYQRLTDNTWYDGEPDWSPDGNRIAFESARAGDLNIYVMSARGTNVRQLTDDEALEQHPDWSPDGRLIVFEVNDGNDSEIFYMTGVGTERQQVTNNAYNDRSPQFSPDGSQLVTMTDRRDAWEIAILNFPGGDVAKIFDCPSDYGCRFPSWSPDGTQIAFNTLDSRNNADGIWIVDVANDRAEELFSGGENGRVVWSNDGTYIFFNRTLDNSTDLFYINVSSGKLTQVTSTDDRDYAADWAPYAE